MNREDLIQLIENDHDSVILAKGFEDAFIGVSLHTGQIKAIYDREKCIDIVAEDYTMSHEDAEKYFILNVESAYAGELKPEFIVISK